MQIERLREKVLETHYPKEEELEKTRKKYQEISDFIENRFGLKTHFAGSSGRGTAMRGDRDIDIFVLFSSDINREKLEDKGLEVGEAVFSHFEGEFEVDYAEHPYTKGEINSHEVEIVPCYDVDSDNIQSAVDRSPHHSHWLQENLDDEMKKDVVLLKVFLRSRGLYGSSLKVEGFSGYLCEVLIKHYGSFENLIENAAKWKDREIIDIENHHEGVLSDKLKRKFSDENLIVIDPVDRERNVASVLSRENYSKFIYSCWKFLQDPGINFFERGKPECTKFEIKQELDKRGDILVLEFDNPEEIDDITYPQMRKTLRRIEDELEKRDFRVFDTGFHIGDKTRIIIELDRELPENQEVKGPKFFHGRNHLEQFTSKYRTVYVKDDRLCAKTDREFTDAKEFLKDFLKDDLEQKGIPGNIAEKIKEHGFTDPLEGEDKWLNYLATKLHVCE